MATRRLERQRRGEVPSLVPGYVDITSNYYTDYTNPSSSSRRLSSGTIKHHLKHSKRPRSSNPRSISEVDIAHDAHDMQDSDGFADIHESDEEASPPEDLPPDMLHQVQAYLDLTIATNQMQDYIEWNELDASWKNNALRHVDLNDDRVISTNMSFACRYMIVGWTGLFDLSARIPYAANELVAMMAHEVLIWCNMFCRMLHIDFIHLFTGVDILSLRKYIDGDLDTDNTGPFFAFLDDHRRFRMSFTLTPGLPTNGKDSSPRSALASSKSNGAIVRNAVPQNFLTGTSTSMPQRKHCVSKRLHGITRPMI